jgi:hypothetical protein
MASSQAERFHPADIVTIVIYFLIVVGFGIWVEIVFDCLVKSMFKLFNPK